MVISRAGSLLTLTLLFAVAGCGGGSDEGGVGAAEPAQAPGATVAPAGDTAEVGDAPQGIVYDARTKSLAVAVQNPYRLLLLDPTTLEVRTSVALPGKVRHLQVAEPGGPVLVPDESADQLIEVFLPGGSTRVTDVQSHPHDAAAASNGDVIVGNEFSGSITVVREGKVLRSFADLTQPGGVIADGTDVAVVDVGAFTLSTYDLTTMKRTGRIAAGEGPTHGTLTSGHRVVVSDTRGGQLLVDSMDPLKEVGRLALDGSPYGLASDSSTSTVWVTLTAKNELVGLDLSTDTPRVIATYPTVGQPDTVAVAPGSHTLWVTGTADGVVQRITR
ncbi:MAG: YncE family protein [Nocardioidaceae bacterium]